MKDGNGCYICNEIICLLFWRHMLLVSLRNTSPMTIKYQLEGECNDNGDLMQKA